MRFADSKPSRAHRFSLGRDGVSGSSYPSIPVANRLVDYDEYDTISPTEYDGFMADEASERAFANACRRRRRDERLILKPGADRGVAT